MAVDLGGLILHKILSDPVNGLEAWSKLKLSFFSAEYTSIYSAIARYYAKNGVLPSFSALELSLRDKLIKNNVAALKRLKFDDDIPIELIVDSVLNEYTQAEALKKIEMFLDNITLLDSEEIKQELSNIVMFLEEKTHTSEKVCLMSDITLLEDVELKGVQIPLNFNNTFDAEVRASTSELIMVGGHRGSGKSVVSTNIVCDQYLQGNAGLYFSIEMDKREVFNRAIAILSNVSYNSVRKGEIEGLNAEKIAKVRADMFVDADELYNEYLEHRDFSKFEQTLVKEYKLKPDNQLVIVDNSQLTLADIDLNIQKFKTQFGDKLKVVVVDYVNQISIDDIYSWKQQIMLSKQLKAFARKYDVVMVTPYQIDKEGEARFAKGLLDAADIAMTLKPEKDYIEFKSTKTRNTKAFTVRSMMNWESLRIHPEEYIPPVTDEKEDSTDKKLEKVNDMPW